MKDKMNIVQFAPYFPPHTWGVETVTKELAHYWIHWEYGQMLCVVCADWQHSVGESVVDGISVLALPSFELVSWYPCPNIFSIHFWRWIKTIYRHPSDVYLTHTRFFLSTLLWWILSKIYRKHRAHIEHGSSAVQVRSRIVNIWAKIYDCTIGYLIFRTCDIVFGISQACATFIQKFVPKKEISIIYRWLDLPTDLPMVQDLHQLYPNRIIVWCVWRLVQRKNFLWVIQAYYALDASYQEKIQLVIIWWWEEAKNLVHADPEWHVHFLGQLWFDETLAYQSQFDIHIHPSHPGGWLATTLLQAMYYGCMIVATPHEWAAEVIHHQHNWILVSDSSVESLRYWIIQAIDLLEHREDFATINKDFIQKQFDRDKNSNTLYTQLKNLLHEK